MMSHNSVVSVASHLDPKYGGIAAMLPELCSELSNDRLGRASLLGVCGAAEASHVPEPMRDRTSTIVNSRWGWLVGSAWKDQFAERISTADVVHIHGLWDEHCVAAARAARALGKPYVISAHGMLEPWALRNKRLKKALYAGLVERKNVQQADCLHALTLAEAEDYRRFGARNPIAVIPNGVRVPTSVTPAAFFTSFPELRDRRLVLFLGRLHRKKGLDLLIEAWRAVAADVKDAHLVLAGPDVENTRAAVEAEVARLGLEERVTFTGMLSGELKWSALAASELFVLPSYSEGLSMSVLEALGMGKPVVITRQCHVPEVGEHDCGWTIEPQVSALAEALLDALHTSTERRARMGSNGRSLVEQRFSWPSVGKRMRGVYEWVLGGSRPADLVLSN